MGGSKGTAFKLQARDTLTELSQNFGRLIGPEHGKTLDRWVLALQLPLALLYFLMTALRNCVFIRRERSMYGEDQEPFSNVLSTIIGRLIRSA